MTVAEHSLLISMFMRQEILLNVLTDILGSHGLLSEEDLNLFRGYRVQSELGDANVSKETARIYSEMAKNLGLHVPVQFPSA